MTTNPPSGSSPAPAAAAKAAAEMASERPNWQLFRCQPGDFLDVTARFHRANAEAISEILETLCPMGHAHREKQKGTFLP